MQPFVFKLGPVLEQRKHAEFQCQRELAETHQQIIQLELALQEAMSAEKRASVPLRGRVDPRTLATQVRFAQVMSQKLAKLRSDLDALRRDLAVAHAALVEAAKGRKVLEKLEEKQRERWIAEQQKREFAAQDDLNQRIVHDDIDRFAGGFVQFEHRAVGQLQQIRQPHAHAPKFD